MEFRLESSNEFGIKSKGHFYPQNKRADVVEKKNSCTWKPLNLCLVGETANPESIGIPADHIQRHLAKEQLAYKQHIEAYEGERFSCIPIHSFNFLEKTCFYQKGQN